MNMHGRFGSSPPADVPSGLDRNLWSAFAGAKSDSARTAAWLALVAQRVPGTVLGMVIEADPSGDSYQPTAVVPDARRNLAALVPSAEKALGSGRPAALPQQDGSIHLAYPVTLGAGRPPAAVVLELRGADEAAAQAGLREIHWAAGWLAARGWESRASDETAKLRRSAVALDILAVAAEHPKLEAAAMAMVNEIQTAMKSDQVTIGMVRGRAHSPRVRVLALSYSAWFRKRSSLVESLETAMEEAFDQMASVSQPPIASLSRSIAVAHAEHLRGSRTKHMLTVPLADAGGPVGALTLERRDDRPYDEDDRQMAEAIAALVGPMLELKRRNRRWFGGRLVDGTARVLGILLGPRHLSWKLLALALAALAVTATRFEIPFRIQADAVVRGSVSRAVAAPFAGFIAEAPLRAGDRVQAGQLLVRLDDADLQLEALRWRSEVDRLGSESREALAKKDRAQVALAEAKIAQARAQADLADAELARSRLVAPIDGLIISGDLSQKLGSPVQLGEILFEIAPLDDYRIDILVDERDLRYVSEGMSGRLALIGQPSDGMPLTVARVTPLAEVHEGVNAFRVEARLDAPPQGLRPGMDGVAKLDSGERLAVWVWSRRLIDWARQKAWTWQP